MQVGSENILQQSAWFYIYLREYGGVSAAFPDSFPLPDHI